MFAYCLQLSGYESMPAIRTSCSEIEINTNILKMSSAYVITSPDSFFAICYRQSVCRLSVTLVRRTQAVEIFGNISTAFSTLAIR